jgi:hypothetical protein
MCTWSELIDRLPAGLVFRVMQGTMVSSSGNTHVALAVPPLSIASQLYHDGPVMSHHSIELL